MGAYFNPNFRRGEPELASRVRYDHPLAMSGSSAAAIRNHQREKMNALSQGEFIVYVRVEGGLCFVLCNFLVMFLCCAIGGALWGRGRGGDRFDFGYLFWCTVLVHVMCCVL